MQADGSPSTAPFFIVGSGRSGSTLLRLMLCSHSRITIPPETWYLLPLLQRFGVEASLDAAEIDAALAIITQHYRWPDQELDAQQFKRGVSQITAPRLRDVVEVVYRWHMQAQGKARWGDKTPVYIEILPELARMFPDARFIHLVRDGRDVAKSHQAAGWYGPWLHDNTREWTRALDCDRRWIAPDLGKRILQVHYEELILDAEATLRRICRFLGEEFESQMLSWEGQVDEQIPDRERRIHTKLARRSGPDDVARWKREMTDRELFVAEAFMGAHLSRLGYERRYPGALWGPAFALTRLYCRTVLPAVAMQRRAVSFVRRRLTPRLGVK